MTGNEDCSCSACGGRGYEYVGDCSRDTCSECGGTGLSLALVLGRLREAEEKVRGLEDRVRELEARADRLESDTADLRPQRYH